MAQSLAISMLAIANQELKRNHRGVGRLFYDIDIWVRARIDLNAAVTMAAGLQRGRRSLAQKRLRKSHCESSFADAGGTHEQECAG